MLLMPTTASYQLSLYLIEANEAADYLSHLSTILWGTVAGPLSDLDLHRVVAQGQAL
jgi:hypothetical protein